MPKRTSDQPKAQAEFPAILRGDTLRVFISWSGPRSKVVAEAVQWWLRTLFQDVELWISTHNITAGERWATKLAGELQGSNFGIVCLTPENLGAPWILFEAGALSKSVEVGQVVPYLFGLNPADVEPPLGQFQSVESDEAGTRVLVESVNQARKAPMQPDGLRDLFTGMWPMLKKRLDGVPSVEGRAAPKRDEREILEELVASVRGMQRLMETWSSRTSSATSTDNYCTLGYQRIGEMAHTIAGLLELKRLAPVMSPQEIQYVVQIISDMMAREMYRSHARNSANETLQAFRDRLVELAIERHQRPRETAGQSEIE